MTYRFKVKGKHDIEFPASAIKVMVSCPNCHKAFLKLYKHSNKQGGYYECPSCGYGEEQIPSSLSLTLNPKQESKK
ncbi:MAG TPA: hypothetical protein VEP90_18450 [Methylomirabilota bacterium]|nr:hypothetical protein [Methylomirabilota bacterium]